MLAARNRRSVKSVDLTLCLMRHVWLKKSWVRVKAGAGEYEIIEALGDLGEPEWPEWSLREWIRLAFQDRYIESPDHPVLRALRGEV
jgi:hypothetical protein